jgi:hypothetical protein
MTLQPSGRLALRIGYQRVAFDLTTQRGLFFKTSYLYRF